MSLYLSIPFFRSFILFSKARWGLDRSLEPRYSVPHPSTPEDLLRLLPRNMLLKGRFGLVPFKEVKCHRIVRPPGQTVVDDTGLGLCELGHLRVECLESVGVLWMCVNLWSKFEMNEKARDHQRLQTPSPGLDREFSLKGGRERTYDAIHYELVLRNYSVLLFFRLFGPFGWVLHLALRHNVV